LCGCGRSAGFLYDGYKLDGGRHGGIFSSDPRKQEKALTDFPLWAQECLRYTVGARNFCFKRVLHYQVR